MNCICTLYDDNFKGFVDYSLRTFDRFACLHGYEKVCFDKVFDSSLHPSWNKLNALLECFKRGYQRVFWADADSLFVGQRNTFPDTDFITSSDSNGLCLSHMLVRNTQYNTRLLQTLLFLGDVKDAATFGIGMKWEQNALKALTHHFDIPLSFFPAGFVKEPKYDVSLKGAQFLHYAVTSNEERVALMLKHYKEYE